MITPTPSSLRRIAALTVALLPAVPAVAGGDIVSWINPLDGQWSQEASWLPHVPTAGDYVLIGASGAAEDTTVTMTFPVSFLASISISDGMRLYTNGWQLDLTGGPIRVIGQNQFVSAFIVNDAANFHDVIAASLSIEDGARSFIDIGARLYLEEALEVEPDSELAGAGSIWLAPGATCVNDGSIYGTAGLRLFCEGDDLVDLDGNGGNGVIRNLRTTAAGLTDPFNGDAIADGGREIEMDLQAPWTLGNGGLVALNGALFSPASLTGVAVTVQGAIDATGPATIEAQVTMDDGTIQASGDDQTHLVVESDIVGSGGLLIADGDATFELGTPYALPSSTMSLGGGTFTGAHVTNMPTSTIRGFGTVENRLVNDGIVFVEGGTLAFTGTLNDWDGDDGNGVLQALNGDLHLSDVADASFGGAMFVAAGYEIFVDGFGLTTTPTSSLYLNAGTLRSADEQRIGGHVDVIGDSSIDGPVVFQPTAQLDLVAALALKRASRITAGATASGGGMLTVGPLGTMTLDHGVSLDVDVLSSGILRIGDSVATVTINGDAASNGALELDIVDIDDHDRLVVNGQLTILDTVRVTALGAAPQNGDAFDLVDFTSFVDTIDSFVLPLLAPELEWDTSDFATEGVLRVGPDTCLGDIDDDGDVDFDDLITVLSHWDGNDPWADIDQSGVVGFGDLLIVLAAWGSC